MTVKSKLLGVLEQQKGKVLSGEKLAEELNCTRAAIWKAVKSLREEGYIIEAGPNKGYMLVEDFIIVNVVVGLTTGWMSRANMFSCWWKTAIIFHRRQYSLFYLLRKCTWKSASR